MKTIRSLILAGLLALVCTLPVFAQSGLTLSVTKAFGYNLGSQIRGTFILAASGPSDLQSVTFFIDGKPIGSANAAPFTLSIRTTDYPSGVHELSATGQTASGETLNSNVRRFEFVTPEQEQKGMTGIIGPVLGLVAVLFVVMIGLQYFAYRSRSRKLEPVPLGAQRKYGFAGGAICPRCGRPTPLHVGGINLGLGSKLDFCENCGYYGRLKARGMSELRKAEEAERQEAQAQAPIPAATPEEKLKQQIDASKYEDMK